MFSQHKYMNNGLMLAISNKKGGLKPPLCFYVRSFLLQEIITPTRLQRERLLYCFDIRQNRLQFQVQ